jgi:hypothetical protein
MTRGHREEIAMKKRPFGSTKREVAIIGQGTWYIEQGDSATAIAALRRGLDLGMNHIDTAEMYGSGAAETLVGEAIAGRRDEVSRLQGPAAQRFAQWDDRRLRAVAEAAQDGPPRLLSAPLARLASSQRHRRRLRAASRGRQDPVVGRQ